MPGVKRKVSTTSFNEVLQSNLGIVPAGGNKRVKKVTRKEKRRAERLKKRKPPSQQKRPDKISAVSLSSSSKKTDKKEEKIKKEKTSKKVKSRHTTPSFLANSQDPDDLEIARLEKLLGVSGKGENRVKSARKLNKEYEMYEGIGGNFGDFLMKLDDFAEYAKSSETPVGEYKSFLGDSGGESDEEVYNAVPKLLNDSDQEASDVDVDDESEELPSDSESEEGQGKQMSDVEADEDGEGWFDDIDDYAAQYRNEPASNSSDDEEPNDERDESSVDESEHSAEENDPDHDFGSTYRPVQGEDIYGRKLEDERAKMTTTRYIPPSLRKKMQEATNESTTIHDSQSKGLVAIDKNSEQYIILKRKINGQLNRLSEQSRDSIVKGLQDIFSQNSFNMSCHVFTDCILGVCSNASQLMSTLIPLYSGLIAALHFTVDFQIGSFILENLVIKLFKILQEDNNKGEKSNEKSSEDHALISNKTSTNLLLIVINLYNLRVIHHSLIMNIFFLLINENKPPVEGYVYTGLSTLKVELIVCLVENCGPSLRGDDPVGLKQSIVKVMKMTQDKTEANGDKSDDTLVSNVDKGRVAFLLSALSDLKNNKSSSRKQQIAQSESIQQMRKWIGRVKTTSTTGVGTSGDGCLHISLVDFLQAESRGRWWRAGASWAGRTSRDQDEKSKKSQNEVVAPINTTPDETKNLLKVAGKLGMNTDIKKNIFLVVMSSRDVTDAFERLARLNLKGKQEREVIRVLAECCASEKQYNEFYSELAGLLCTHNRQYKLTLQYAFWDLFKMLSEDDEVLSRKKVDRRAINMARMLAYLTVHFHLSLSIFKVVDVSDLSSPLLLFLATYFMSLFSARISNETFTSVLDRVSTTADCLAVREFVLIFLQHHLKEIPSGLNKAETKLMEKRRKETIRTMDAMSVLDIAQGVAEKEGIDNGQPRFDDF